MTGEEMQAAIEIASAVAVEVQRFGSINAAGLRVALPAFSEETIARSVLLLVRARLVVVGFDGVVSWRGGR